MTYLLQVSICWIVLYGIYMFFLQKETFFSINRYYLLSALLAGLIIPFLGGFLPANQASTEIYQVMYQVSTIEITNTIEQSVPTFTWLNFLKIVYSIGALIVFSRFIYGLYRIYAIYKSSSKTILENYTLVESSCYHLPFSFFHFIFISKELPLNKDVEKILKHEELHAHQWHSLDIVITELLQVFFWFNPILIFYKNALKQSHEFLADAYVTQDHNRSSYGQLLLRQSTSGLEIALANHFFQSQIKKRITMMYKEKSKRPAMVKYLVAIPVLAAMLFIFSSSKMNDQSKLELSDECLSILIVDHNTYSTNGQPITISEFEAKMNSNSAPKCVDINYNHSTFVNSITPILKAASQANIDVRLNNGDISGLKGLGFKKPDSEYHYDSKEGKFKLNEKDTQGDPIYKVVEEMPRFPGCEEVMGTAKDKEECAKQKMLEYIYENLTYPSAAKNADIDGITIIQFIVQKDGKISGGKIVKDIGGGCGTESLKVVNSMPKWIPGKQKGEAVNVQFTLPIKFKLEPKELSAEEKNQMVNVVAFGEKSNKAINDNLVVHQQNLLPKNGFAEEVFKVVEEMPRFPGCENSGMTLLEKEDCAKSKMLEFLYTNIKYPREARDKGVEGKAVVQFIIEKDGTVSSIKMVRDPGAGLGDEAIRIVNKMPKWIPGKEKGKIVSVQYTIPIKYKLEGKNKKDKELEQKKQIVESEVDQIPLFPETSTKEESQKNLLEFVSNNIKYPEKAIQNGIEGLSVVKFVINTKGEIQKIHLIKSPGWGIDESVLSMMEKLKQLDSQWTPASLNNKNVNYEYTIPVKFKLQDHQINKAKSRKLDVRHLKISPNPSNGIFTLTFELEDKTPANLIFYSVDGKVIKTYKNVTVPYNNAIDLSDYSGQTIFMNILQNDKIYSDKVIIQ